VLSRTPWSDCDKICIAMGSSAPAIYRPYSKTKSKIAIKRRRFLRTMRTDAIATVSIADLKDRLMYSLSASPLDIAVGTDEVVF
jgi:hypothetical protein